MYDIIIIAVLVIITALAVRYIIRAKKSGKKCIGCPDGGCSTKKSGCGGKCYGCSDRTEK